MSSGDCLKCDECENEYHIKKLKQRHAEGKIKLLEDDGE